MDHPTRPRAAACPEYGREKELPEITAERLYFACGAGVERLAVMPNGSYAVAVDGRVHAITPSELHRYQMFCRHAVEFEAVAA